MNLSRPLLEATKLLYGIGLKSRRMLPRMRCHAFGASDANERQSIERIYVINLDRQPGRWDEIGRELRHVLDSSGTELAKRAERYSAFDARSFEQPQFEPEEIAPFYTLRDQLFVEPQPRALPERMELDRPIRMSPQEIAVARSHLGVWRRVADGNSAYSLVLEDDVWFHRRFARHLDQAWHEIESQGSERRRFDILYLSYKEVKHGAQKSFLSDSVFRPVRGLWYMSGYVLSREGATKLLELLPCRGPVDLWINHQFEKLEVRATRQSIISQRRDFTSTNSYSILPSLTRIGILDCEGSSLFQTPPLRRPVFAFGVEGSGLSSLALALSMLGYRCCSDLQELPAMECEQLLTGGTRRVFDAYVNIGSLKTTIQTLIERYPHGKFIVTAGTSADLCDCTLDILDGMAGYDVAVLRADAADKWKVVCEHLKCAPPVCSFPDTDDLGQRVLLNASTDDGADVTAKALERDRSPWVIESRQDWSGIQLAPPAQMATVASRVSFQDCFAALDPERWLLRDDTFAGNLGPFRPSNIRFSAKLGAVLSVKREFLGVREYSAASISSRDKFLFGRFEAVLQATKVPGVVTGFFLHRDSPRQEIDVEIVGNRSDCLLVNVFYNPGGEGAKYDYGYRGAPSRINLGFDASEAAHRFAIEWDAYEIRWLVDEQIVHRRVNWAPTPIPQLPMILHVNTWPTRSRELAGRLATRRLPAAAIVKSITVEAHSIGR